MKNRGIKWGMTLGVLVFLGLGCGGGERYGSKPVDINIPDQWSARPGVTDAAAVDGWLSDFRDQRLWTAVRTALNSNPDVLEFARKVAVARQMFKISRGRQLPEISGSLGVDMAEALSDVNGEPAKGTGKIGSSLLSASWEPDLWGRLAALKQADTAEFEAAVLDYRSAKLSYAAMTAKAWFSAVAEGRMFDLSREVYASFRQGDALMERRFEAGLASAMDLRLIRAEALTARDAMVQQEMERDRAVRALELLMGNYPSNRMDLPGNLPEVKGDIPCGLPSDLLARRPDIAAAKKRILSRDLRTLAAEKALLPSLSLTAAGGFSSLDLKHLVRGDYPVWNLGGNLALPLFRGGVLQAEIKVSSLAAKEAWLAYGKNVLGAFKEAEDAIDAERALKKRRKALTALVSEAQGALDKAWDLYLAGETEITSVLDSKRTVIRARKERIAVSLAKLVNRVNLYLALGGAFETGTGSGVGKDQIHATHIEIRR